jgi:hypothetical protein
MRPEETMTGSRKMVARLTALALLGALSVGALSACGGSSSSSSAAAPAPSTTTASPLPGTLAPLHPQGPYAPKIDPANFVDRVTNPLFPLKPGTAFHYRGIRGTTPQTDDMKVTDQTIEILGITATVVRDTVSQNGHPIERTFDWYAQDKQGNVWYMGEDSLELKNGHFVKASDSWESGVDGARPGIIMPADPRRGDAYRQEFFPPGEALDQARVLKVNGHRTVPDGSFKHLLVTAERSPLEPQTEQKYYARGIGEIAERVVKGHHEQFQLIRVKHP